MKISPADAFVFVDKRDDSVDDDFSGVSMVHDTMVEVAANYHGGGGPITFADGHAEFHRPADWAYLWYNQLLAMLLD